MVGLRSLVRDILTDLVDRNALDSLVCFCKPEKANLSICLLEGLDLYCRFIRQNFFICFSCGSLAFARKHNDSDTCSWCFWFLAGTCFQAITFLRHIELDRVLRYRGV